MFLISCGGNSEDNEHSLSNKNIISSEEWLCTSNDGTGSGQWTFSKDINGQIIAEGDFCQVYEGLAVVISPFSTGNVSINDNLASFSAKGTASIEFKNNFTDTSTYELYVELVFDQNEMPVATYSIEFLNPDWSLDGEQLTIEGAATTFRVQKNGHDLSPEMNKLKPTGDWKPKAKYFDNNKSIEIYLQSYCTEFHNEVPDEGQLFDEVKQTGDAFFKAYSRFYNSLYSICANSYGINVLDKRVVIEKDYRGKLRQLFKKLALIQYKSYEFKELLFGFVNQQSQLNSDKYLFDQLFQRALWIKTDNISPESIYDVDDDINNIIDMLELLAVHESDKSNISNIMHSINNLENEYINNVHESALDLLDLINQYDTFSSFSELNANRIDLIEAKKKGLIDYKIEGTGRYAGNSLKLIINSYTDDVLNLEIPDGLVNTPINSSRDAKGIVLNNFKTNSKNSFSFKSHFLKFLDHSDSNNYDLLASASVQSMMSVASIRNVTLNDPNTQKVSTYSSDSYQNGQILITGSDNNGTTAQDTSTGSNFIINKLILNSDDSDIINAEAAIIEQVKTIVASGGVPPLSIPGVSHVSIGNEKVAIYCYGKFIGVTDLAYGIKYGVFDETTGKRIQDIVSNYPEIIQDSSIFRTLFWVYYVNNMTLEKILNSVNEESYYEFFQHMNNDIEEFDIDPDTETEIITKCFETVINEKISNVCTKYLVQDGTVVDILFEISKNPTSLNAFIKSEITEYEQLKNSSSKSVMPPLNKSNSMNTSQLPKNHIHSKSNQLIEFTSVPFHGERIKNLKGKINVNNIENYKLAVYIYNNGWWIKPYQHDRITPINNDRTWVCDITTSSNDHLSNKIKVFLLDIQTVPPLMNGNKSFPQEFLNSVFCEAYINRKPKRFN